MIAKIEKSTANGSVYAPSSKSMAHRLLICAALTDGESTINKVTFSEDILATLDCLKTMGAKFEITEDTVKIQGLKSVFMTEENDFYCRESGSTLRFFVPLLLLSNQKQTLHGAGRLMQRPMEVYETLCKEQNLLFSQGETLTVCGSLKAGDYYIKGDISSQFITGLLFALSCMNDDSRIHILPPFESASYVGMTIASMKEFGVEVCEEDDLTFFIKGGQKYQSRTIDVEGDYSGSAFLDAFNFIGGKVETLGLNENSLQGDMIYKKYFTLLDYGTPNLDVSDCPDLAPILMTLAAERNGAKLLGTKRLKIKESDRGVVMAQELSKFGADIELFENEIVVHKSTLSSPKELLCGHNDHRIVMSLAVLSSVYGGEITDAQAVAKSFPNFFEIIKQLGVEVNINDD